MIKEQTTTIVDYPNGGQAMYKDNVLVYTKYNTGDEVWFEFKDWKYSVIKVRDHMGRVSKMSGIDPYSR